MIPAAGQLVGPYEILGRLGRGGMGLVFSAWDSRLQRDVAIKLLREEYIRGDSYERFLNEARAASGLNHPNICTVFDIGEQDGDPYLVMELLKGDTLRSRISSGRMPPEEVLHVGIEIADALTAAHARGIIHRDIKPANIFLVARPTGGWQAKVLDFGLAKVELPDGLDPRYQMTGLGTAIGTVAYMSPEQARGEVLDARSDLFALGIVLYEMATGHVPFEGVTSALIFVQLLSNPPQPIRQLHPGFPKDFERIILKLLAKDRSDRFQSSAELLDALRKVDLTKGNSRVGMFGKPAMSWVRNSVANSFEPKTIGEMPPLSAAEKERLTSHPSAGGLTSRNSSASEAGKSSSEAVTIRPIRRQPLPPTEFSASAAHWVRPPRLSGLHEAVAELSGTRAAAAIPAAPARSSSRSSAPVSQRVKSEDVVLQAEAAVAPAEDLVTQETASRGWRKWLWRIGALIIIAVLLAALLYSDESPKSAAGPVAETLMLGSIANHSGDKTLDGVVPEGLRLALAQSPHLTVPDKATTSGTMRSAGLAAVEPIPIADARKAAKAMKAANFLSGEIRNEDGAYVISVQIYSAATGASTVQAEETAGSREQIADAIDRVSVQIRTALGESSDALNHTSVPLARDATSNIEAMEAYVAGTEAETGGRRRDAMIAFQRAVGLEPKFTHAWLELANIYGSEHAEVAAAEAATHAQEASVGTSDRTRLLVAASFQRYVTADYARALTALDQLALSYPLDVSTGGERAWLLRAQGEFSEALETAQETLARNPYDVDASAQAEYAMLALGRQDAAAHLEAQAEQRGQHHPELRLLLAFIDSGGAAVSGQEATSDSLRTQVYRAQLLDATGQFAAGLDVWKAIVNASRTAPALISASSYAFAEAALNRALANDCAASTALSNEAAALPRGQKALFAVAMAQGLCRDLNGTRNAVLALMAQFPQSFAVKHYYLANLTAIDQIRSGDSDRALVTLQAAKQYDSLSLTPYLRGLAHSSAKQWPLAIADFQFVLLHHGATVLNNPAVYAMSQLGAARAYAASGDRTNSAAAYAAFLNIWKGDSGASSLVTEAHRHVK